MKTTTRLLWAILICLSQISSIGQNAFNHVFYKTNFEGAMAYAIHNTLDGNLIMAGYDGNAAALVIKLDTEGNILWDKEYTTTNGEQSFFDIVETTDGFLAVGYITPYLENTEKFLCLKLNSMGDVVWAKKYDFTTTSEFCFDIETTDDGGFILTGNSDYGEDAAMLAKISSTGDLSWMKQYTVNGCKLDLNATKNTLNGGFITAGTATLKTFPYTTHALILKTSNSGVPEWAEKAQSISTGCDIIVKPTEFLFTMTSNGLVILKTDLSGTPLWAKYHYAIYSPSYMYHSLPSTGLVELSDGGYIYLSNSYYEGSLIRFDQNFNPLFDHSLMFTSTGVTPTIDGGFMAVGNGPIFGVSLGEFQSPHIGIYKTDSMGDSPYCNYQNWPAFDTLAFFVDPITVATGGSASEADLAQTVTPAGLSVSSECVTFFGGLDDKELIVLRIVPNPNPGRFQLLLNGDPSEEFIRLEIFDFTGKKVYQGSGPVTSGQSVDLGSIQPGIYILNAYSESAIITLKFIVSKT
jgi:hypothetical protein